MFDAASAIVAHDYIKRPSQNLGLQRAAKLVSFLAMLRGITLLRMSHAATQPS